MTENNTDIAYFTTPMLFASLYNVQNFMQYNFFSLSKNKRTESIKHKENLVDGTALIEVRADHEYGLATIWDADIIIYLISIVREAIKLGEKPNPYVSFTAYDFLQYSKRDTGGKSYASVKAALLRLRTTTVKTTITRDKTSYADFNFLDGQMYEEQGDGKNLKVSVKLSDWIFKGAIDGKEILKLSHEYFNMKGGLERFLYMTARKHAGKQTGGFEFTFKQLYEKSGSNNDFSEFSKHLTRVLKKQTVSLQENDTSRYKMFLTKEKKKEPRVRFLLTQPITDQTHTCKLQQYKEPVEPKKKMIIGNLDQFSLEEVKAEYNKVNFNPNNPLHVAMQEFILNH